MATTEQELNELRKQVEAERQEASGLNNEALDAYWDQRREAEKQELLAEQARIRAVKESGDSVVGTESESKGDDARSLLAAAKAAMNGGAVSGGSVTDSSPKSNQNPKQKPESKSVGAGDLNFNGGE